MFEDIEKAFPAPEAEPEMLIHPEADNSVMKSITSALQNLNECCRRIFTLYLIEGYDHEEISEILSVSESTSRSMLSRARKKMAIELGDMYHNK